MIFDLGIFLAAAGITMLEIAEASAVGLALYADSGGKPKAFLSIALGTIAVFVPTFVLGQLIAYLPLILVKAVGGVLLLYFGLRLIKSARRSVVRSKTTGFPKQELAEEEAEKGIFYTGFSVGAIEAFEAAIVLVGLLPNNFSSASLGFVLGIVVVIVATYVLRNKVRKVKQADMKVLVSAILLTFSAFWFTEIFLPNISDLFLIPLFIVFALLVYSVAHRGFMRSKKTDESSVKVASEQPNVSEKKP